MTTRTYGSQYDVTRTVTEDAASIRRQVKAAQKDGRLPADWKISVTKRRSTHQWAIDITCASPRPIYAADPFTRDWVRHAETGEHVIAWADKQTLENAGRGAIPARAARRPQPRRVRPPHGVLRREVLLARGDQHHEVRARVRPRRQRLT